MKDQWINPIIEEEGIEDEDEKLMRYKEIFEEDAEEMHERMYWGRKIFKVCFKLLAAFCTNNQINQNLMWKYKEAFCFSQLGKTKEIGELEFVHKILEGNENITRARTLQEFIEHLDKRKGCDENFIWLLEIYQIMIDIDSMSQIRSSLLRLILKSPEMLRADLNVESVRQFDQAINVMRILAQVLKTQDILQAREEFR